MFVHELVTIRKDITTDPVYWEITATKSGYTPLTWNLIYNQATSIANGVEGITNLESGKLKIYGYARSIIGSTMGNVRIEAYITWVKDTFI